MGWKETQIWERDCWNNIYNHCCNTFNEERKQLTYAPFMGLEIGWNNHILGCEGKRILDIGGGPTSLLLKTLGVKGTVVDPCEWPGWVSQRYASLGIEHIVGNGEDYTGTGFDEVWIYNVLQHVVDPEVVISVAKRAARRLRLFEWVGYPSYPGHPNALTAKDISRWVGQECRITTIETGPCVGGNAAYGNWEVALEEDTVVLPFDLTADGHLGGFAAMNDEHPHGDDWTWTPEVWDFLVAQINPKTILDVGCGQGHATKYFLDIGIDASGVDGSLLAQQGLVIPSEKFILHDFTQDTKSGILADTYDMVWCCEFVEHIDAKYIDNVLDVFRRSKVVAMTHAFPGQGGHHHINCQYPGYWIAIMAGLGFVYNDELTQKSRKLVSSEKHWARSGMVFTR